jgi:hypothetical protein
MLRAELLAVTALRAADALPAIFFFLGALRLLEDFLRAIANSLPQ